MNRASGSRRTNAALLAVAIAAVAGGAAVASGDEPRRSAADCRTAGSTVAASRTVRLYRTFSDETDFTYYACATRTRQRTRLGQFNGVTCGVRPLALNGDHVASFDNSCLRRYGRGVLTIRDIPHRRMRRVQEKNVGLFGLELTAAGSVVWIRSGSDCPDPGTECPISVQVRASEPGVAVRVLEDSSDIDLRSLALAQGPREPAQPQPRSPATVFWTVGGQPRSAQVR